MDTRNEQIGESAARQFRDSLKLAGSGSPPPGGGGPAASKPRVWIVYAREDEAHARALLDRLKHDGIEVSWDRDLLPGVDYDEEIERQIKARAKVVAIWSVDALQSRFVLDEATLALEMGKLVPVHVTGYDVTRLPLRFRRLQSVEVRDYDLLLKALGKPVSHAD